MRYLNISLICKLVWRLVMSAGVGYENMCKLPLSGESPIWRAAHHCRNRLLPCWKWAGLCFWNTEKLSWLWPHFGNCFSAGLCLRIEMRYMPTGSVLQVFLQNIACCKSLCYFYAWETGWVGLCKHWKACFLWRLWTCFMLYLVSVHSDNTLHW